MKKQPFSAILWVGKGGLFLKGRCFRKGRETLAKIFNVSGACRPDKHYMVELKPRLEEIKAMIDAGAYFTINRARQYGKTTTLHALADYLKNDYIAVNLDFQRMSYLDFENESAFVNGLAREIRKKLRPVEGVPYQIKSELAKLADKANQGVRMAELFDCFSDWCAWSKKPVVFMIDEVDTAANNQVFLDFLAQLRATYLDRDETPAFQSVILAGVYDIRNIRRKLRNDKEHMENSPWNIAADFLVNMSFTAEDIAGLLQEYEADYHTNMDVGQMADILFDYTSGYPYLVSRLCKFIDERVAGSKEFPDKNSAWTRNGFLSALKILLEEHNPLFDSLTNKLSQFPELDHVISCLLFQGQSIAYNADDAAVRNAQMFGLVKIHNSTVQIANRIFETRLYNRYLSDYKGQSSRIYTEASRQKNLFITAGYLDVRRVLEKFVETFHYLYGEKNEAFLEDEGRRYFMLFLKPIINGVGNCSVEPRTRNNERMDLVIYYHGEQSVIEMKVWRGNAYNERGEKQLSEYLDYFHLKKGYMLSFNFNKKKEIGVKEVVLGDKLLIEAVV